MNIFVALIYQPLFNLIVVLYRTFGNNLGFAILAIAIISRIITFPLVLQQRQMFAKSKDFNKKMNEVKEKHKNDKEKQQKELMALQTSQLSGCIPLIVQAVLLLNIYQVVVNLVNQGAGAFNNLAYPFVSAFPADYKINYNFLNILDLSKKPAEFVNSGLGAFLPYLIIVILVAVTQYLSAKLTMRPASQTPTKDIVVDTKKKKRKDEKVAPAAEDFTDAMQKSMQQTMIILPLFYAYTCFSTFQSGIGLYLIITSLFVIIQSVVLNKLKEKKDAIEAANGSQLDKNIIEDAKFKNLNV